jgi:DNA-binding CsgD family transcriptional regulator/PAS domain-containing protein
LQFLHAQKLVESIVDAIHSDAGLLKAVGAIYDAASDSSHWPRALTAIAGCFGDVGARLQWRRDDGVLGTVVSDGPCREWKVEAPAGAPVARRQGPGWIEAISVSPDPYVRIVLSIRRRCPTLPFSAAEHVMIGRIGRHVENSLRLSIRAFEAELDRRGLGDALTRLGIGVFVLDSRGRVTFSNAAGRRLMGKGVDVARGRLRIGSGSVRCRIDEAILQALRRKPEDGTADPKAILVRSTASEHRIAVYLLPAARPAPPAGPFWAPARAILLAIEQSHDEPADPAVVRDLLGLTPGEARVASLVGSGISPREAAARLGIAEVTARNVLKRVFAKAGVSRQGELVGLLARLVLR